MEDASEDQSIGDNEDHQSLHVNGAAGLEKGNAVKDATRTATNGNLTAALEPRDVKDSSGVIDDDHDDAFDGFSGSDQNFDRGFEDEDEDEDLGFDSDEVDDSAEEEDSEDADEEAGPKEKASASRAELRKMMSEEQRTVVKTITEATKADAEKGRALKHQRKAYDALLNTRIRLQKALIAVNSLPLTQASEPDAPVPDENQAYAGAEEVAIRLWTQLSDLRSQLHQALPISHSTRKRKRDSDPSLSELAQELRDDESAASSYHLTTLEKWSGKVRGASSQAAASKARLNNSVKASTMTDVLREHLSQTERLVKRTQMARSCAPLQAASKIHESAEIYDDADFYQLQLKELIEQRMTDSTTTATGINAPNALANVGVGAESGLPLVGQNAWTAMREAKTRKKVDTRASKGRKMRYTVHDKLQNFMVPDDRGSWGKRQIDELFGSLLGARMRLDEDDVEDDETGDMGRKGGGNMEDMEGLMLFRGR